MLLITDLQSLPQIGQPCGLTIGSFDGVHLGHQELIRKLKAKLPDKSTLVVFTFSNHPSHLFTPSRPVPLLSPPLQKVRHLKDAGADIVFLVPFDLDFSKLSFKDFLLPLHERLRFSQLTLGIGATFGRNKEGHEANVKLLAKEMGFEADYLQKFLVNGTPVSSGRIRTLVSQGHFSEVQECLGRPYSLMGGLIEQDRQYHLQMNGICLPPDGTYQVKLTTHSNSFQTQGHISNRKQRITLDIPKNRLPMAGMDAEIIFQQLIND